MQLIFIELWCLNSRWTFYSPCWVGLLIHNSLQLWTGCCQQNMTKTLVLSVDWQHSFKKCLKDYRVWLYGMIAMICYDLRYRHMLIISTSIQNSQHGRSQHWWSPPAAGPPQTHFRAPVASRCMEQPKARSALLADSGQQLALAARPVGFYNLCWEICYNWLTLWCIIDVSTIGDALRLYDLVWLTNTSLAMVEKWRLDLGSFQLQQAAFADLSFSGELHSFICSASMPSKKWNPRYTMLCNAILPDYILHSVWTLRCQQQCQNGLKKAGR